MLVRVELLRPDDLLYLTIEAHNMRLDQSAALRPELVQDDEEADAFLVAIFPPQAFGERAFSETATTAEAAPSAGGMEVRISGRSRLAFRVPPGHRIPFDIPGLLDWGGLEPSLVPVARVRGSRPGLRIPSIRPASATETSIELPYRLHISALPDTEWRHRVKPVTAAGLTELWHTRLVAGRGAQALETGRGTTAPIRAIHSPDYVAGSAAPAGSNPLDPLTATDRDDLVAVMSTFRHLDRPDQRGTPAQSRRLALTALGGFLDVHGRWSDRTYSLESWTHKAALGRDNFVEVVRRGRLFPSMHRATVVATTERRIETSPADLSPVSYLRKYVRVLIAEPTVSYDSEQFRHAGREMPFAALQVNVTSTPKIDIPATGNSPLIGKSFPILLDGRLWPFPLTATDRAGNRLDLSMGMFFVDDEDNPSGLGEIAARYGEIGEGERYAPSSGGGVKLAAFDSDAQTSTFISTGFVFGVDLGFGSGGFLPSLARMDVRVPSLEAMTGARQSVALSFNADYLASGLDDAAGLFADVVGPDGLPISFSASQTGGISTPNLKVRGFSSLFGPIGGKLDNIRAGIFHKASAFAGMEAKLFGAIDLVDLLASDLLSDSAPRMTVTPEPPGLPTSVVTTMQWDAPTARTFSPVKYQPSEQTRLVVDVKIIKSIADAAAPPTTEIVGRINDFSITLGDAVKINFDAFRFSNHSGKSPSVAVDLSDDDPVIFLGGLAFLNKMNELLPPGLFGPNGPRIDLRPEEIEVGIALGLPPAALGAFSIRNVTLNASLTLPYLSGRPSFAIGFSSREKPFLLSVTLFGGGGFVRVHLDTEGIKGVEAMLEFGGVFALDVGVASGSIQVLAGIYVALLEDGTELTGYIRYHGEVTILVVASVSADFIISLSYIGNRTIRGLARVELSARVGFVSKSVSFEIERKFSAGSRHVSIGETMDRGDWETFALAFEGG